MAFSNIVLVADDNSGAWTNSPHMSCLVFDAPSQALRIYSDNVNYNPFAPSSYTGTIMGVKNQLLVIMGEVEPVSITVSADPVEGGEVSGDGNFEVGEICTLTATPYEDFLFLYWTCDGNIVSTASTYSFNVTREAEYVAHFEEKGVVIGEGTATNQYLPSYSYYNYSLTQQIYTASEIGTGGFVKRLSFYNAGGEKTRNYEVYLVHTDKTVFESGTDWIPVSENDLVFSGTVTMATGEWTTLTLDTPFAYDGVSNLAVVVDDNSGEWTYSPHMACRVYNAEGNQSLRVYNDDVDYDPFNPNSYNGTLHSVKNQIILKIETAMDVTLGEGTDTNQFLPSYSFYKYTLSQQIYTASEIGAAGFITHLSFYNDGDTETRSYDVYMTHTDKTVFENVTDWITVSADDLVFSGTVTMTQGEWTTFVLDTPFEYDGVSNLALVMDDNTGSWTSSPHMACRVYDGEGKQAIRVYNDNTDFNPYNPSAYNGTLLSVKNQLKLSFVNDIQNTVTQTISLAEGSNWVSFNVNVDLDGLKTALLETLGTSTTITIKSKMQNVKYHRGRWTGSLETLDMAQMYQITVTEDCEITLEGMPVNPSELTVTIAHGANWMAYPYNVSTTVSNFFGTFPANQDQVKSRLQNVKYNNGRWGGSLTTLEPGQGYIYVSTDTNDRTFAFPASTK